MIDAKRNVIFFSFAVAFFLIIAMSFSYIIDPYGIFHETKWNRNVEIRNDVVLASVGSIFKSLRERKGWDAILLGTSMNDGYRLPDLEEAIQCKRIGRLSVYLGSNQLTLRRLAWEICKHGEIRSIIWDLYFKTFEQQNYSLTRPIYGGRVLYLLDKQNIYDSCALWRKNFNITCRHSGECNELQLKNREINISRGEFCPTKDTTYRNYCRISKSHKRGTVYSTRCPKEIQLYKDYRYRRDAFHYKYVWDSIVFPFIETHRHINFYFVIPPQPLNCNNFTRFYPYAFDRYLSFLEYVVQKLRGMRHVKIYAWHDMDFVKNVANTFDYIHYSPSIHRYISYCIKHNLHQITADNYNEYKKRVIENIRSVKIDDRIVYPTTFEELVAYEESLHPELKEQKVEKE